MIESSTESTVAALRSEVERLTRQRETDRAGIVAAIERIDRSHAEWRAAVFTLREVVGGLVAKIQEVERLAADVTRLQVEIDALSRIVKTVH